MSAGGPSVRSELVRTVNGAARGRSVRQSALTRRRVTTLERIDRATKYDGKISRREYFDNGVLTRVEEDTDGDGKIDKWETYRESRLLVVEFDTTHRGTPDRRIIYDADANGRVEVDLQGTGHFVSSLAVQNEAEASVTRKSP